MSWIKGKYCGCLGKPSCDDDDDDDNDEDESWWWFRKTEGSNLYSFKVEEIVSDAKHPILDVSI